MPQYTLIVAIDLGTSATTASHARVRDFFDNGGKLRREKLGNVFDVKDWPDCIEGATGNVCVPTDLVFYKRTRGLLFWGYAAQQYLDDPYHNIPKHDVFVVETIKLLLPDPDEAKLPSVASVRYREMREVLIATLGKQPDEVFEDFLGPVIEHILHNAKRKYSTALHNHQVELVLAFPSGWPDEIHTKVARIGARALEKAIAIHKLKDMSFGIENVYTVSETLCGVKEWLREAVAESSSSSDFDPQTVNLDELNEGDCFLPVDIGGGTGCLTPLKLVSKIPLGVEQLDKTQSLEVSGEAVQAEFERWLRPQITDEDHPGDIEQVIYQICRKFKEEKKKCGTPLRPGNKTWNVPVPRLKANPHKGFENDCIRFDRRNLDECFDPVIDILDIGIEATMRKYPAIKVIVFLGQFGGNSAYLQNRMIGNSALKQVKLRHSQSGKMDVVKGAISERLTLRETFVRKFKTLKSYGTLVTLVYSDEVAEIFPNPRRQKAVPFERANDGLRLKVIEWAIPKGTVVQDGRTRDIGKDGRRHHTWPFRENDLGFEDTIIVSDEEIPAPQLYGKSYTLWTEAHQSNQLYINGQRRNVQHIPFCWDLIMSQKLDINGNIVGPYSTDDLRSFMFPEKKIKGHRREKLRDLHYDLIWRITEMQVKVFVQAIFPNQVGPPMFQLAKQQALGPGEKTITGESRSKALDQDIEISHEYNDDGNEEHETSSRDEGRETPSTNYIFPDTQLKNEFAMLVSQTEAESLTPNLREHQHMSPNEQPLTTSRNRQQQPQEQQRAQTQQQAQVQPPRTTFVKAMQDLQAKQNSASSDILRPAMTSQRQPPNSSKPSPSAATSSSTTRTDGRRRDGCYTCKDRKKKCDSAYIFDETSGTHKCNTCLRFGVPCDMTQPEWVHDAAERTIQQQERRRLIKLGKRKSMDESESSRDRSMTYGPELANPPTVYRSVETATEELDSRKVGESGAPVRRGTMTAIRGGLNKYAKHSTKYAAEVVVHDF